MDEVVFLKGTYANLSLTSATVLANSLSVIFLSFEFFSLSILYLLCQRLASSSALLLVLLVWPGRALDIWREGGRKEGGREGGGEGREGDHL